MGGGVALRVLLATDVVKAASFWSTMAFDVLEEGAAGLNTPVVFHHSSRDSSTSFGNSISAAHALIRSGGSATLHIYDADDHYFVGERRELAADRDAAFFISSVD
jgi:dienelactone hydrolase